MLTVKPFPFGHVQPDQNRRDPVTEPAYRAGLDAL